MGTVDTVTWQAVVAALVSTLFWGTWCAWSMRRDRRRLRNGFLLVALGYSLVGLVNRTVALLPDGAEVLEWVSLALLVVVALTALVLPFFLVANGLTMIRSERRTLGNLLSLLAGVALLAAPVVVVGLALLDHPLGYATATVVALGGAWLAYFFLGFVVQTWQYRRYARRVDARAVIVLGSRVISGTVPPLLAARLRTAVDAARRLGDDTPAWLVPSGGQGADETVPEGRAMATWLVDHGVPAERVVVEDRARTTRENLVFSATLLRGRGIEPPYLVATNSYHAPRAALQALDLGIEAHAIGAPTAPYYFPSAYLREFLAVLRARRRVHVVVGAGILLAAALVAYAGWSA